MRSTILITASCLLALISCKNKSVPSEQDPIKQSLLFHASFDKELKADYSIGDPNLYDSPNRNARDTVSTELAYAAISHITIGGMSGGGALKFEDKSRAVAYFKSHKNLNYTQSNWQGTISFWLSLDPNVDLKPGYCDPIQITDVGYNDASIWVDFTRDSLRQFRLGVIGDLAHWNPDTLDIDDNPAFEKRLVYVKNPPFNGSEWTHVVITHSFLGSDQGIASLYLDGKLQGTMSDIKDPFDWNLEESNIYLGLSYIGLFDELMIFDRPFSAEEVIQLGNIEDVKSRF